MSLTTAVTDRISSVMLVQITNHDSPSATSLNSTRLAAAVADVEAIFEQEVGVAFDASVAAHVPVGVDGVLATLHQYTGITGRNVNEIRQRFERGLIRLAQTLGGEQRLLPSTSSKGTVSEQDDSRLVDYDRSRWDGFVPRMPNDQDGERFAGE